jgi:hypothetical protein
MKRHQKMQLVMMQKWAGRTAPLNSVRTDISQNKSLDSIMAANEETFLSGSGDQSNS